ncbi:MAG: prephenate dehydratase [Gammaproteobacteria bacterium]|nr:prephenate dehydratase [Gammaproteobacteria bacterium]
MTDKPKNLDGIRLRIDELDEQIQHLINERGRCAQQVAEIKSGVGHDVDYYRAEREAQVLRQVIARNQGPLTDEDIARLFREIMSSCLALEQKMRIAFLGPEGTFSQDAALKHFGHAVVTVPHGAIDEIFRDVESGLSNYGVVPVENSTEGVVNHTLDMFLNSPLKICGEVELRIHHCLLAREMDISKITKVYGHQQALAQCREWLDEELKNIPRIAVSSNAKAASLAFEEAGAAAIASATAAEIYGLEVLVANIEDEPDNTTRFLIIGRKSPGVSGKDKTSLLLSTTNRPGALARLLVPLAEAGISMTRIESRPSRRGMWDYVFFVDIEGHAIDAKVATALDMLRKEAAMLKVLGSYPVAVL